MAMRSKRCICSNCNTSAIVTVGTGACGKTVLCSSDTAVLCSNDTVVLCSIANGVLRSSDTDVVVCRHRSVEPLRPKLLFV